METETSDLLKETETNWVMVCHRDGKTRSLSREMLFVGREECDIILGSPSVDKRHAVIFYCSDANQFHVKDLNSTYGTYINDTKLPEQSYVKLNHMDRVRFGFAPDSFIVCRIPSPEGNPKDSTVDHVSTCTADGNNKNDACQLNNDSLNHHLRPRPELSSPSSLAQRKQRTDSKKEKTSEVNNLANSTNNSNSSLSTVDSLDEIQNKSHQVSKQTSLSPLKETSASRSDASKMDSSISANESAMAFTITFDESPRGKRPLNIGDSLRKFAPPRPETIEKVRQPKPKNSTGKGQPNDTSKPKLSTRINSNKNGNSSINNNNGHLSDSASYLIQRMLSSEAGLVQPEDAAGDTNYDSNSALSSSKESSPEKSSSKSVSREKPSPLKSSSNGEKDSGVCDDKSESGTYTIGVENNDPIVEEARKRIDEVFGINEHVNSELISSMNSSPVRTPTMSPTVKPVWLGDESQVRSEEPKPTYRTKQNKLLSEKFLQTFPSCTFSRPKRKLPTLPTQSSSDTEAVKLHNLKNFSNEEHNRKYSHNLPNVRSEDNPGQLWNHRRLSFDSSTVLPVPSPTQDIVPSNNRNKSISNSRIATSSEIDLNHCDTSSNKSDESEPGCRSDTNSNSGSSMRFNRAFALRRARLGMDTFGIPLNTTKTDAKKPAVLAPKSTRSTPSPTNLNRNDGGRFSLRVSKSSSTKKPPIGNVSSRSSSKEDVRKPFRSGINNDIHTSRPSSRISVNSQSDVEYGSRSASPAQSSTGKLLKTPVQRSSSFADSNGVTNCHTPDMSSVHQLRNKMYPLKGMVNGENFRRPNNRRDLMSTSFQDSNCLTGPPEILSPTQKPKAAKELSALDALVVSAINQLSQKLTVKMRRMLEKSKQRCSTDSETRLMIEELLPQVNEKKPENQEGNAISRDLSSTLKNMKKIEQSLEVMSLLLDCGLVNHKYRIGYVADV